MDNITTIQVKESIRDRAKSKAAILGMSLRDYIERLIIINTENHTSANKDPSGAPFTSDGSVKKRSLR